MRIVFSWGLLLFEPLSTAFFAVYILCGLTDVLDGYIARKTGNISSFGATFDSAADVAFFGIILWIFLPIIAWTWWELLWIGLITCLRLMTMGVGYAKYKTLAFLHTWSNKATGAAVFLFPMVYRGLGEDITIILVCILANLSSVEELMITVISKELIKDRKSIFIPQGK